MIEETRATIALSADAGAVAQQVRERFGFAELMDVARLGTAVAIANGVTPVGRRQGGPVGGTWSVGNFDLRKYTEKYLRIA